jgi:hypothetical protein
MRTPAALAITALAFTLSACVYVPTVKERDAAEAECKTLTQSISMDAIKVGAQNVSCHNEECAAMLAGAAVVSAGSAIISGSIVLTGNTIHWLEYQGTCSDGYLGKTKRLFLETFSKEKTLTTSK